MDWTRRCFSLRIIGASVTMSSNYIHAEQYSRKESLKTWSGGTEDHARAATALPVQDSVQLSSQSAELPAAQDVGTGTGDDSALVLSVSPEDRSKAEIIQRLIEIMTGKKIRIQVMDDVQNSGNRQAKQAGGQPVAARWQPQDAGWGLQYDASETYAEQERMSFAAEGVISTGDGREIRFSAQINLSREFTQTQSISLRAGAAASVDPLVINFDGKAAQLTDSKFSFDLNSDGDPEQISFVQPGSGFLVLDRDSDGKIDQGTDLFGPGSGDGFTELAQYDADSNGWIDEGDPIFSKLRIWSRDARGNDSISTLSDKGVGAIYLGNVSARFDLKNQENTLQGVAQRAGIYVTEDGSAGTIQQIDLTL